MRPAGGEASPRQLAVIGVPSGAGACGVGQDQAPAAPRNSGLIDRLGDAGLEVFVEFGGLRLITDPTLDPPAELGAGLPRRMTRPALSVTQLGRLDLDLALVVARARLGTAANLRMHLARDAATSPTAYRRTYRGRPAKQTGGP